MAIDYYYVLGIKRTCSNLDILNAFRKIVWEFGMDKLNEDATNRRLIVFEAYDVLSDPFWREQYDQFGDVIKLGIFVNNEQDFKRYSYHNDIFLTYKSVYGSTNPYAHVMSMLLHMKATPKNVAKPDAIRIPISLTLNEIFFGTLKKINVPKSCGTQCIANVRIPKGLPTGSEIIYNLDDGRTVIFVTNDLPHQHFVRSGHDLIRTYDVSFKEMIFGVQYIINTLDHKRIRVNITQVITPTYQKNILGEGMPIYGKNDDKRGDIILKFNIPFNLSIVNKTFCETL